MKISEKFNLNKTQYELDFIDIDINADIPLFINSNLIRKYDSELSMKLICTMDSFFSFLLNMLSAKEEKAKYLCSHLGEINETHLGLSRGQSQGRGVGSKNAEKIFETLKNSDAIKKGVLENIEDLRILVNNFGRDMLSDMLTNILKKHLLEYTINQCNLLNIKLTPNVPSGFYWDEEKYEWNQVHMERLIIEDTPVILVPKGIVDFCLETTDQKYKQHFVLNFLQEENLRNETNLVQYRKDKTPYVTKKDIKRNEPTMNKDYLIDFTMKHKEVFENFKKETLEKNNLMAGNILEDISIENIINTLSRNLLDISYGSKTAQDFHNIMIGIFEFLLYPKLINPKKEKEINEGRKRIDICFSNIAENGFFGNYVPEKLKTPCPLLFVECKNYSSDIQNPELDQLIGRFSRRRGRLGILSCRKIDNENLFLSRCIDTYKDDNGLIIPITDNDIIRCFDKKEECFEEFEKILYEKSQIIVSG